MGVTKIDRIAILSLILSAAAYADSVPPAAPAESGVIAAFKRAYDTLIHGKKQDAEALNSAVKSVEPALKAQDQEIQSGVAPAPSVDDGPPYPAVPQETPEPASSVKAPDENSDAPIVDPATVPKEMDFSHPAQPIHCDVQEVPGCILDFPGSGTPKSVKGP